MVHVRPAAVCLIKPRPGGHARDPEETRPLDVGSEDVPDMEFDLKELRPSDRYKLLAGVVVPRPIALVTTLDPEGRANAAPFSFLTGRGSAPPLVALGIGDRASGGPKDTARNIALTKHFVVNLVDESLAEGMNVCAVDFPVGVDELRAAGLAPAPSVVRPPPPVPRAPRRP